MTRLSERVRGTLEELRAAGTYKVLRHLTEPMAPVTTIEGVGEVLVFCSNNYLGLANHPEVVRAGIDGLERYGAGTASVRFICLSEVRDAAVTLVVTDGVFSMEGDVARLPEMADLCRRFGATLIVDDSHGVGVLGAGGRGTPEHFNLPASGPGGVGILTGTLGKALGGAAGGYVAGPHDVINYLIQRSRPQLFSNALPPTVACSAAKALEILEREPERVSRLHANVDSMRAGLRGLGYDVLESPTAIRSSDRTRAVLSS